MSQIDGVAATGRHYEVWERFRQEQRGFPNGTLPGVQSDTLVLQDVVSYYALAPLTE